MCLVGGIYDGNVLPSTLEYMNVPGWWHIWLQYITLNP